MRHIFAAALVLCAATSTAFAQEGAPPPQPVGTVAGSAHNGFFLRLMPGVGVFDYSSSVSGVSSDESGSGPSFAIEVGHQALAPNLYLFGALLGRQIQDPSFSGGGMSGTETGVTITDAAIGPGLTYYLQPMGLYLGGMLTIESIEWSENGISQTADGVGLTGEVGKEWSVSPTWNLGVAGQLFAGSVSHSEQGVSVDTTSTGLSVLFSATYY